LIDHVCSIKCTSLYTKASHVDENIVPYKIQPPLTILVL